MKKRLFAALLAVVMVFALTSCSVSSSSTSTVSTSVTDSEGNTTTHTTTTEVGPDGVTTTNETTTTTAEETDEESHPTSEQLAEVWHERYNGGAHGTSKDGDEIYFAFDDLSALNYACLMDITEEGNHLVSYEGEVYEDEDGQVLDNDNGTVVRFTLTDNGDDTLLMTFLGDGDKATLTVVDEDTIIDQMVAVWADFVG